MDAHLLPDGRILVPRLALGDGLRGDGVVALDPSDPLAREWIEWYEGRGLMMPSASPWRYDAGFARPVLRVTGPHPAVAALADLASGLGLACRASGADFEVRHAGKGGEGKYRGGQFVPAANQGAPSGEERPAKPARPAPPSAPSPSPAPAAGPREGDAPGPRPGLLSRLRAAIWPGKPPKAVGPPWADVAALSVGERQAASAAAQELAAKLERAPAWDYLARVGGGDAAAVKADVAARCQKLVDGLEVHSRVPSEEVLLSILDSGFKNQFQVGRSMAVFDPRGRAAAELSSMGLPPDTPAEERPIYGYLAPAGGNRPGEAAANYGKIVVQMKPAVKDRTTVSMGDSWQGASNIAFQASPISAMSHRSIDPQSLAAVGLDSLDSFEAFQAAHRTYIEPQVHGGVAPTDIAHVDLPAEPGEAVRAALTRLGISWAVYDATPGADFEAQHAPKGGASAKGRSYKGGQFVPSGAADDTTALDEEQEDGEQDEQEDEEQEDDEELPEWDGTIDLDEVDDRYTSEDHYQSYNTYDEDGRAWETDVYIEEQEYDPFPDRLGNELVTIYRWMARADGVGVLERGPWTADRDEAVEGADRHIADNEEEPPEEDDDRTRAIREFVDNYSDDELVTMFGAPEGATVTRHDIDDDGATLTFHHPKLKEMRRSINVDDDGELYVHNDIFVVKDEYAGEGLGASVFGAQVEGCAAAGLAYIETHAAGSARSTTFNGYYTWPRFGYDMELSPRLPCWEKVRALMYDNEAFEGVDTVQDLFEVESVYAEPDTDEEQATRDILAAIDKKLGRTVERPVISGRDWWLANGSDLYDARFDLSKGSRSRTVWYDYLASKNKSRKG